MSPEPTHRNVRIGGGVSVHRSHDRPRLEPVRMRDVSTPESVRKRPPDTRKRPHRDAFRALYATLTSASGQVVGGHGSGTGASPEGAQFAREAMRVARAFLKELGSPPSPSVHGHALGFGLQLLTAQRLTFEAVEAGLGTDRGRALAADAQRAQGRAERSWTACVTAAGLLGKAPSGDSPTDAIERRAAELLRQRRGGGDGQ